MPRAYADEFASGIGGKTDDEDHPGRRPSGRTRQASRGRQSDPRLHRPERRGTAYGDRSGHPGRPRHDPAGGPSAVRNVDPGRGAPGLRRQPQCAATASRGRRGIRATASSPARWGRSRIRLYRPAGTAASDVLPALVYYHGGGWLLGDLDSHDAICRRFANATRCRVISVDYRMAPEHVFPGRGR